MSLELKAVAKSFTQEATQLEIIKDLSLRMSPGETLAIIGESGSGKSTLLSLIAGFESPERGEILWNNQSTGLWQDREWSAFRKKHLGFVFQNYHLIPYLTAVENIALPLRLLRQKDSERRALKALEELGLGARASHLPNQLSGGERQRVAIARAMIHRPNLLLADEPTGSLDVTTGAQVLEVLFAMMGELKQTAIVVTHSHEVAKKCARVLSLKEGRLCSV